MKKISFLILLFSSFICFGQNGNVSVKNEEKTNITSDGEIEIDIDRLVYINKKDNSYFSEDEKSAVKAMLIPMSFETMKTNMQKGNDKKGVQTIDKGVLLINGINVLFVKSISADKDVIILIYCKENDKNSSISFISFYPKDKEKYYKPFIEKAFLSAKNKI